MKSDFHNCQDMQSSFDSFELGILQLSKDEIDNIESHMSDCSTCQQWLSDWELIKLKTLDFPQLEVPAYVLQGVIRNVDMTKQSGVVYQDWLFSVLGLVVLLGTSAIYASADAGELLSWCLGFLILAGANFLMARQNTSMVAAR